ncbi:MAG: fluoride efflux transporter FluC [Rubripirellula sp.]|jgi:CrcB protein
MTTWLNLLAVATGGAVGSVCRYLITVASIAIPGGSTLLGTTLVNVVGCAAIGGFAEVVLVTNSVSERTQLLIRVGFLGGLTTFSTFAGESAALADEGRWFACGVYVAVNLLLGWAALVLTAMLVKGWLT